LLLFLLILPQTWILLQTLSSVTDVLYDPEINTFTCPGGAIYIDYTIHPYFCHMICYEEKALAIMIVEDHTLECPVPPEPIEEPYVDENIVFDEETQEDFVLGHDFNVHRRRHK
jgi:hypothetical protein